jgi:hypothetical protein
VTEEARAAAALLKLGAAACGGDDQGGISALQTVRTDYTVLGSVADDVAVDMS